MSFIPVQVVCSAKGLRPWYGRIVPENIKIADVFDMVETGSFDCGPPISNSLREHGLLDENYDSQVPLIAVKLFIQEIVYRKFGNMAGRGRGRGRGISFNIEALGFARGEALPSSVQQPPPLFPPQEYKPVGLLQSDDTDYMLALKQEFRGAARKSPYFLNLTEKKRDIDRYSDKYQLGQNDNNDNWKPDWTRLPKELRILNKKVRKVKANIKPNKTDVDVLKTLENLEKKDGEMEKQEVTEEDEEKKEEEEGEGEIEIYDEDDLEEETDYNLNYFDNGEGYGDDDDDVDDGPIY